MMTLEELNAHYKAVRERINGSVRVQPPPPPSPPVEVVAIEEPKKEEIATNYVDSSSYFFKSAAQVIIEEVAEKHGMTPQDIKGDCRKLRYVVARQEAAYLIKRDLNWSLSMVGRALGKRDHTTVINLLRKHAEKHGLPQLTSSKG